MGIVAVVLVSALSPEPSLWRHDAALKIRLVIAWHQWRLHKVKRTASGDVICWSCATSLGR
jgi:hypothetical protein